MMSAGKPSSISTGFDFFPSPYSVVAGFRWPDPSKRMGYGERPVPAERLPGISRIEREISIMPKRCPAIALIADGLDDELRGASAGSGNDAVPAAPAVQRGRSKRRMRQRRESRTLPEPSSQDFGFIAKRQHDHGLRWKGKLVGTIKNFHKPTASEILQERKRLHYRQPNL